MNNEKTIKLCGKDVRLRYCAATENGFEQISGKSINDINFNSQDDITRLAVAAILAAYAMKNEDAPVTSDDILYNATSTELTELFTAIFQLRAEWYATPKVVEEAIKAEQEEENEDEPKNA